VSRLGPPHPASAPRCAKRRCCWRPARDRILRRYRADQVKSQWKVS